MVGTVISIVTVVILLFISMLLVSKVRSNIDQSDWTAEENNTFDDVKTNANTSFSLMAIALIVLVAFLIISILRQWDVWLSQTIAHNIPLLSKKLSLCGRVNESKEKLFFLTIA